MTTSEVRELLDDVFEEEALVIGGIAELHGISDEAIDRLIRSLAVIRDKVRRRIDDPLGAPALQPTRVCEPRPAIEQFLARLGRG